jgi:hypothetical protein
LVTDPTVSQIQLVDNIVLSYDLFPPEEAVDRSKGVNVSSQVSCRANSSWGYSSRCCSSKAGVAGSAAQLTATDGMYTYALCCAVLCPGGDTGMHQQRVSNHF